MEQKKFLTRIFIFIFLIFLLNCLAMKFYWYSSIWYFDMIMHFLGGFWIGLAFLWVFKLKDLSYRSIFYIILGVLFIGFLWELFEILVDDVFSKNPFNFLDSISDIFFDLAGGCFALWYFLKKSTNQINFEKI